MKPNELETRVKYRFIFRKGERTITIVGKIKEFLPDNMIAVRASDGKLYKFRETAPWRIEVV